MRWEGERQSDNVEDRRGSGGGGGFGIGGRGIGVGTIVLALIGWGVFGINPLTIIGMMSGGGPAVVQQQGPAKAPPAEDKGAAFVSTVLASTEDAWSQVFAQANARYTPPRLVLFRGATPTACGTGQSAMGPFYCPGDQKVYLDMDFFDTLSGQLGAPGDFARAYVVAHEVGHHVQNLMGLTDKVDAMRGRVSQAQQNALSVRLELQADCFAGIWANKSQQARSWLEQGDIESAMNAASKIGDDALQKRSQGYAVPDSFTHGSSAQRMRWFSQGFKTGSVQACDTFGAQSI
ncbi:neutral zinc metallopeptidase [Ottowia sp.]|uniref:KPN_02809 family neutral zinc metallopeptidase n=1 Tax=Ottowia sp. TaxID=1898956 RepID=UPI0039E608C1